MNDYRLQLFVPGKTYWNYIADIAKKNLVPGQNTYTMIARDKDGNILDKLVYTVTLTTAPLSESASSRRAERLSSSSAR